MVTPRTLEEALEALAAEQGERPVPYAGGTELMTGRAGPRGPFLFLHRLSELRGITQGRDMLRLGAGLSFSELIESPLCPPLLLEATRRIAAPGVRNLATLGGNICHASPAADSLPPLYLYDAVLVLASRGPRGPRYRRLPIGDFILGPRRTALRAGELLTAVELPRIPAFSRWTYEKVGARKAQAVSKVSFAAAAVLDQEGVIRDFRAAFGAVGPTVIRRRDLEESLRDRRPPGQGDIAGAYGSRLKPIDDQRSTAEYRRTVCLNLLNHFLEALGTGPFTGNHAILR